MSTLIMADATTKSVQLISQSGLNAMGVDVAATPTERLIAEGKHTLASQDPYSKDRHLSSVVRQRVDTLTSKRIEVGCNITVWSSNHPSITSTDKYDVIWASICAITGETAEMDAATKLRIDKHFAGANIIL
jgi:phosphoribosylaminoimidazole (AIR) synthetase